MFDILFHYMWDCCAAKAEDGECLICPDWLWMSPICTMEITGVSAGFAEELGIPFNHPMVIHDFERDFEFPCRNCKNTNTSPRICVEYCCKTCEENSCNKCAA